MATANLLIKFLLLLHMKNFVSCQKSIHKHANSVTNDTGTNNSASESRESLDKNMGELVNSGPCEMDVSDTSSIYFRSMLKKYQPYFMHLVFVFLDENNQTVKPNKTRDSVRPDRWVWTHSTPRGVYPYLNWNTDFYVLSFNLLSAKTLPSTTTLYFHTQSGCPITFGTYNTTKALATGLRHMASHLSEDWLNEDNYFCFLAEVPGVRNTWQYTISIYTTFPIGFVKYNCCVTYLNYTRALSNGVECINHQISKLVQNTEIPYIIGIVLFLYCPVILLQFSAWVTNDNPINRTICPNSRNILITSTAYSVQEEDYVDEDDEWTYLGSIPPMSLVGLLTCAFDSIKEKHKTCWSRFRRAMIVILSPAFIFVQLLMYLHYEDLDDLIDHGTPVGFLSLLGNDREKAREVFVPLLGGATGLLTIYYILGLLICVVPPSLKDLFETGFHPPEEPIVNSPLFFGSYKIFQLCLLPIKTNPGYGNCALLCKCSIYLIFSKAFWKTTLALQVQRFTNFVSQFNLWQRTLMLPFYIAICIIESCMCILFYFIPCFTFMSLLLKGISRYMKTLYKVSGPRTSRTCPIFLDALFYISLLLVVAMTLVFSFPVALVFIASFVFIMKVVMFCFVAIIIFPTVAFSYLLFVFALLYYIVHLVHGFADAYTDLLQDAIDVSRGISDLNNVSTFDGHLHISNVRMRPIKQVIINNVVFAVPDTQLQAISNSVPANEQKVRLKEHLYGIPTELFQFLVKRHRPVHQQVLRIAIRLLMILLLIAMALSITYTFANANTSDISEVMHVIFIVTIGALPRILEVAFEGAQKTAKRDIEMRKLEQSIVDYWQMRR